MSNVTDGKSEFNHGRAPKPVPRMLPRRASLDLAEHSGQQHDQPQFASGGAGPIVSASQNELTRRMSARIAVPDRMIRMTEFGLRFIRDNPRVDVPSDEEAGSRWWARVVDRMESLVAEHLPPGASRVEMALDSETLEVVLEYDVSLRESRASLSICR